MKKRICIYSVMALVYAGAANAQSAVDAYRLAQPDMKGTARFMSMGGAFGALGGDLSSLSQNPAGIGVYRNSEIGFTLDLDAQSSTTQAQGRSTTLDNTRFYLNNIGGVMTLRLPSTTVPNLNFGFTYNKTTSFNRHYGGTINTLSNSLSNYIAGVTNADGTNVADVTYTDTFDPYNPNDGYPPASWLSTLGYYSYLIYPEGNPNNPTWTGQRGNNTSGSGGFEIDERGCVDSYNIAFGGNINNIVFWGMDFDITVLNYTANTYWGESLDNAYVNMNGDGPEPTTADWNLTNLYNVTGTGFNYKLGVIVKPIQELRLGFAFHTPTYYSLTETFRAGTQFRYGDVQNYSTEYTNDGYLANNYMNYMSPWRIIASAAGVISNRLIVSADYEWANYNRMSFSDSPANYDYDYGYGFAAATAGNFYNTNNEISMYYKPTNTLRLGAEFRVTPRFSVRAGYSFVSSPVTSRAQNNDVIIETAGTMPQYRFDNTTNYATCGIGYKIQKFYVDLAYVYKRMNSTYHAYSGDPENPSIKSPEASVHFNNSQIVMSAGFKF